MKDSDRENNAAILNSLWRIGEHTFDPLIEMVERAEKRLGDWRLTRVQADLLKDRINRAYWRPDWPRYAETPSQDRQVFRKFVMKLIEEQVGK